LKGAEGVRGQSAGLVLKLSGKSTAAGRGSGEFPCAINGAPKGIALDEVNLSGFKDRGNSKKGLFSLSF